MGRPTNNPKNISLKIGLDKDTAKKLDECVKAFKVSKAEVIRRGVHNMHEDIPK